jgi:hypothetical protein
MAETAREVAAVGNFDIDLFKFFKFHSHKVPPRSASTPLGVCLIPIPAFARKKEKILNSLTFDMVVTIRDALASCRNYQRSFTSMTTVFGKPGGINGAIAIPLIILTSPGLAGDP